MAQIGKTKRNLAGGHTCSLNTREVIIEARPQAGRVTMRHPAVSPLIVDKLCCDTLLAIEHKPVDFVVEALRRSEHLFVLLADRGTWTRPGDES